MLEVSLLGAVNSAVGGIGRVVVFRLPPGQDLFNGVLDQAKANGIKSGLILGGAASLRQVILRNVKLFPDAFPIGDEHRSYTTLEGPLELLAISGNISTLPDGNTQLHAHVTVSVSAPGLPESAAFGGHLIPGATIFSTGEIAIAELQGVTLSRVWNEETKTMEIYPTAG
jgi:predicted DNA-binding protein with PD1-like motif